MGESILGVDMTCLQALVLDQPLRNHVKLIEIEVPEVSGDVSAEVVHSNECGDERHHHRTATLHHQQDDQLSKHTCAMGEGQCSERGDMGTLETVLRPPILIVVRPVAVTAFYSITQDA